METLARDPDYFRCLSESLLGIYSERRFKGHFGVRPLIVAIVWTSIEHLEPARHVEPIHLLWFLYFCKENPTDDQCRTFTGKDPRIFKKYIGRVVESLDKHLERVFLFNKLAMIILSSIHSILVSMSRLACLRVQLTSPAFASSSHASCHGHTGVERTSSSP